MCMALRSMLAFLRLLSVHHLQAGSNELLYGNQLKVILGAHGLDGFGQFEREEAPFGYITKTQVRRSRILSAHNI